MKLNNIIEFLDTNNFNYTTNTINDETVTIYIRLTDAQHVYVCIKCFDNICERGVYSFYENRNKIVENDFITTNFINVFLTSFIKNPT